MGGTIGWYYKVKGNMRILLVKGGGWHYEVKVVL